MSQTVVVIDDEPDNVDLTVMLLQLAGHIAFGSTSSDSGIALAAEYRASVVVLDFMMPNANGADVGRSLRTNPATSTVKILMCSGTEEATVRLSFTDYEAFLVKPVVTAALLEAIETLCA